MDWRGEQLIGLSMLRIAEMATSDIDFVGVFGNIGKHHKIVLKI